jgi:MFS family permease
MLVLVGCCFMQMFALGTVLNSSSAYFAYVPVLAGFDMVSYVMWISMYGIAALVGTFLGGILLPKNTKLFLSLDFIVVALCLIAFTFGTPEWTWQFSLIGIIMGLFGGQFFIYACPLLINSWFGSAIAGRYLGIANLFSGIGGAIFPLVFTQLFQVLSWQAVYYVNAVLILVLLVFSLTVFSTDPSKSGLEPYGPNLEESGTVGSKPGVPLKYAVGSLAFIIMFVGCIGCAFPGGFNSYIQANAIAILGADAGTFSATLMTFLQIGYIIASLGGGYLCDKIGFKPVTIIIFAITVVTFFIWAFVARTEVAMAVNAFFFGMNNAIITICVPMIVRHNFGEKNFDKILSYAMMGAGLGGAIGSPVIALFYTSTGSYAGAFSIGGIVMIITLILLLLSIALANGVKKKHWEEA